MPMKKNPYTVTNKDSLTVGRKEVGICLFLEYFFRLITLNYFPFPYPYTYKSDPYMTFFYYYSLCSNTATNIGELKKWQNN